MYMDMGMFLSLHGILTQLSCRKNNCRIIGTEMKYFTVPSISKGIIVFGFDFLS